MTRIFRAVFLVLFLGAFATASHADGPHIAYNGAAGPYQVTLFSLPDPLVAGPVQLVLLVQENGALARSVAATGTLSLPGNAPITVQFAPGTGGNPDLPGASFKLPVAGAWTLALHLVPKTGTAQQVSTSLIVSVNHGHRNTVLFSVFALVGIIVLFLANQSAKATLRRRRILP